MEFINVSGLRLDGRRPHEVRRLRSQLGMFPAADGSAMLEMGNTKVLAVVHGPREAVRRSTAEHDSAVLDCDLTIAPFATPERRKRRGGDRRVVEIETALRQCFEAVVELKLYPRSLISVHVLVLQSDGGLLAGSFQMRSGEHSGRQRRGRAGVSAIGNLPETLSEDTAAPGVQMPGANEHSAHSHVAHILFRVSCGLLDTHSALACAGDRRGTCRSVASLHRAARWHMRWSLTFSVDTRIHP